MLDFQYPRGILDGEPPHWYAVIGTGTGPVVHNYRGVANAPPDSTPVILILEAGGADGDAFVSRYDQEGRYIADCWYPSRDQALEDLAAEFRGLSEWRPVPDNAGDVEAFVFRNARW